MKVTLSELRNPKSPVKFNVGDEVKVDKEFYGENGRNDILKTDLFAVTNVDEIKFEKSASTIELYLEHLTDADYTRIEILNR